MRELEWQLNEATEELAKAVEETREQAEADTKVSRKLHEVNYQMEVTNEELVEAREAADQAEWQLERTRQQLQYILRAKEMLRAEMQQ